MAYIKNYNGSPTIFIDDKPVFGAMIMSDKLMKGWKGKPDPYFDTYYKMGYRLFQVSIEFEKFSFDSAYDSSNDCFLPSAFQGLDELKQYVKLYPEVKFLLRVHIESMNPNSAWNQKHPGELEVWEEGTNQQGNPTTSYASEIGLRDAQRYLETLIETVYNMELDEHILGLLIGMSYSAEWCKYSAQADVAADYSVPMQTYFKKWLREKYKTDDVFRKAWGNDSISLEDASVPSADDQRYTTHGFFRDPVADCAAIDYFTALAHLVANNIIALCRTVKEKSDGKFLAGVFYGYLMDAVANQGFYAPGDLDVEHTWNARSGHSGLKEVLESSYIDYLAGPYRYDSRGMGGDGGFRTPYESVRQAGKLWFDEIDIRTSLSGNDVGYGQGKDIYETVQLIRRQYAKILTHNAAAWFCDWGCGDASCFDDPEIMKELGRFIELGRLSLENIDRHSASEIAVVTDTQSTMIQTFDIGAEIGNFFGLAWQIPRIGAPVDFVLLEDILNHKVKKYKLYIMLNCSIITADDRDRIHQIFDEGQSVVLWSYGAGICDGKTVDVQNIADTTGIGVKIVSGCWSERCYLTNYEHPITKNLLQTTYWGSDRFLTPLIVGDDTDAIVLGNTVTREGRFEQGLLIKEIGNHTSLWSAAKEIPAGLLKEIARYAGVHIYDEKDDVLYCGGGFIVLHSLKKGKRQIRLSRPADVYNCLTGEKICEAVIEFTVDIGSDATVIYNLEEVLK